MAKVCDSFCDGCIYKGVVEGKMPCCNYIFITEKSRGCPPGKGCTEKYTDNLTKEERKAARIQKKKEYRQQKKAERMRTVVCPVCGKVFQTTDSRKIYCSEKCRYKGRIMQYKKYDEKRSKK